MGEKPSFHEGVPISTGVLKSGHCSRVSPSISLQVQALRSGKGVASSQGWLRRVPCSPCTLDLPWDEQQPPEENLRIKGRSSFIATIICAIVWMFLALWLHAQDAQFHDAPPSSAHLKNPYAGQQAAVAAGSRLYGTNCSSCHGTHGQGTGAMPALAQGPTQSASDGEVFWFITTGASDKGMPSWSTLPERQRWQLVAYLKSLKNSQSTQ